MTPNPSPPLATPGARRLGLLALGLLLGWSTVAVYAVHAALPFNPIKLPLADRFDIRLLLPEGWAFFTRDPRDDRMLPYRRGPDAQWARASLTPNFQPSNLFGIDRVGRAQGVELGLLMEQVRQVDRVDCTGEPTLCLESAPVGEKIRNRSPNPSLCGEVGVVFQRAVPYAWSRTNQEKSPEKKIIMPSKVLRLDIEC